MEMAMSNCRKESEDERTTKKGKRKVVNWFDFLTDDILSDILKRLSDAFLGYKAKYVCRRWWDLISKTMVLDCASFILQETTYFKVRHVGIREEGEEGLQVQVEDLDIPRIGMIRSWGNEFLLISDYKEKSMHIYNLITKEGSYLPNCNAPCGGRCKDRCGVAISVDVLKEIYKVVHVFTGPPIECHILILRKDIVSSKWKKIHVPSMNGFEGRSLYGLPVSVQGRYIHWDSFGNYMGVVSMDMVKEEIVDISLPEPLFCYTIFEMGGSLALLADNIADKANIWILKDFQTKKWEKLQSVTLEKLYHRRFPVCGVISNKHIILKCYNDGGVWYYDLKNGVMKKLDIHICLYDCSVVHSLPPSFK